MAQVTEVPISTMEVIESLAMWMIGKNMPQLICVHTAIVQSLMILLSDLIYIERERERER